MNASTKTSQSKKSRGFTLVEMLVVIGMIAALAGVSFPVYKSIQKKVERTQYNMMVSGISRAVADFETEYNYLPLPGGAPTQSGWGGDCHIATDALRTAFITILVGQESAVNFKKIRFFECNEARGGPGSYYSGIVDNGDNTSSFYSPWGEQIQNITMDTNYDGIIFTPFSVAKGGNTYPTCDALGPYVLPVRMWDYGEDDTYHTDDDWWNFQHPTRPWTYD
jgi:prepilin-type N-terminal cleavage/methylation domain-containing protein